MVTTTRAAVAYIHVIIYTLGVFCPLGSGPFPGVEAARGRRGRTQSHPTGNDNHRRVERCQSHTNQSQMNSFLWVLRRDPPSFFFGTIHVPHSRVWAYIPENTKEAFYRADHVYFELDLTDPYTISSLANCQLLPRGERLSDVIPRTLYARLRQHLDYVRVMMPTWVTSEQRSRGLYADYLFNAITANWERKRPVWVMLMVNSLTRDDIRSRGTPVLDLYLAQEAQRLEKRTGAVERVEEQCAPLNGLNTSQVLFALNQTLYQHERSREGSSVSAALSTDDLIRQYNCGDLDSVLFSHDTAQVPNLVNTSLSPMDLETAQQIDAYFREQLIYRRNQRMARRIQDLLEEHPEKSFFFAFGAGHYLGNNTVLDSLIAHGYDVYHSAAGDELDLGERHRRRRKKYPPLMADMAPEDRPPMPGLDQGDPYYDSRTRSRHRHGCADGRGGGSSGGAVPGRRRSRVRCPDTSPTDSERLKYPQFNDLWVRLEASSFGPDNIFGNPAEPTRPAPVYAMYNNATWRISATLTLLLACTNLVTVAVSWAVR